MVDNDFDSGVLIGPLAFVVREHEAHRAALKGGLSVAVGGVNVVGDQATSLPIATCSTKAIRTFLFLRKATDSDECCLFRRFWKISAVFHFWRPVLNTWPHRFDRIFGKGHAASTIFRREYAARGLGRIAAPNLRSPEPHVRGGI